MILISTHGWYALYSMESGDTFDVSDVALCHDSDSQGIIYNCSCMTNAFDDATYEPCLSEAFVFLEIERALEIDPTIMMPDRIRFLIDNGGPVIDWPIPIPADSANFRDIGILDQTIEQQSTSANTRINIINP